MGEKGNKETNASAISAEKLLNNLLPLGNISLRKMFGGHGVFIDDKMFALVDSKGTIFFKVDDTIIQMYADAGAEKHGRMPYYQVPDRIQSDEKSLRTWAQSSIDIAKKSG